LILLSCSLIYRMGALHSLALGFIGEQLWRAP
jgi:hypothetical protein